MWLPKKKKVQKIMNITCILYIHRLGCLLCLLPAESLLTLQSLDYLILFTNCFFFLFLFLSCSGPDPPALEIGAFQAVPGEGLGLLPQRWRVFCHWDLKWPSQALQVGNQRNKVKFWLGGFKLMGILYSICQKNDPFGALAHSVGSLLTLFLVLILFPPTYYFLHL